MQSALFYPPVLHSGLLGCWSPASCEKAGLHLGQATSLLQDRMKIPPTITPSDNLELPVQHTCLRTVTRSRSTQTDTGKVCKLFKQRQTTGRISNPIFLFPSLSSSVVVKGNGKLSLPPFVPTKDPDWLWVTEST